MKAIKVFVVLAVTFGILAVISLATLHLHWITAALILSEVGCVVVMLVLIAIDLRPTKYEREIDKTLTKL